jgi:hypothetical protein
VDGPTRSAYDPPAMHGGGTQYTMTELSGTLEGVGLPAIVRFLTELEKTGSLRILHDDWQGEILFEAGQLTSASLGSRYGLAALDALVQALPGASFTFDTSSQASSAPNIDLNPKALQTHLDELVACIASGAPRLPSVDAVPELVAQEDSAMGEDPLPLDRGTLQTLLAVDGQRTVREIVAQRGTFDALWQLGSLNDVALVRLGSSVSARASSGSDGEVRSPGVEAPRVEPAPPEAAASVEASIVRPNVLALEPQHATDHCPKLGFEDDPGNSFARPTRLHRCFAAGTPLPLSLDQQRELCLTDQFGTCPRLSMIGRGATRPAARDFHSAPEAVGNAGNTTRGSGVAGRLDELPSSNRSQLLSANSALRNGDSSRPSPLRARMGRASSAAVAEAEPVAAATHEPRSALPTFVRMLIGGQLLTRFGAGPVPLIVGVGVVVTVLAVVAYMFAPQVVGLFVDDSADLSGLPNASALAAGTPIAAMAPQLTPVASVPSGRASTSEASAAAAPAAPTLVPQAAPATAEPTVAVTSQSPAAEAAASESPAATQAGNAQPPTPQAAGARLLDERFANNARNWPSNPQGTAWLTSGSYRLIPRQAGQFVAIGAPIADVLQDVVVSATFHKLSGSPEGGGFGIIVRDQGPDPRDGVSQGGQYYVLEVGDKGEIGIWRRDTDHWIDLIPWQRADAVRTGTATNDLTVSAIGNRLSLSVNGTEVATRTDNTLTTGRVGLLVGGDGNQVAVDHVSIQTP